MNYLAHALLSGSDEEVQLGNFLGDFVKGRLQNYDAPGLTDRLLTGLRLHRAIDQFTDQHAVVRQSKVRLRPRYGLRAGVIVDMAYDHFLARHWGLFSGQLLPDFTRTFYELLRQNQHRIPERAQRMAGAMTTHDWLQNYARLEAIERSLAGLAMRVPAAAGIQTAGEELRRDYAAFETEFLEFFPILSHFCVQFLEEQPDNRPFLP